MILGFNAFVSKLSMVNVSHYGSILRIIEFTNKIEFHRSVIFGFAQDPIGRTSRSGLKKEISAELFFIKLPIN